MYPPPLNGQSLCSKKLSGKGGTPPPLNGKNPLKRFWQLPLGLKQTGDCFKERTKSNIHLEYQNTEGSLNVRRAFLRPGLYLSEIAPSVKVRRSNIELLMAFQNLWMFTLLTQNKDAIGDHIPKIKCVLLDYLSPPSCIYIRDLKNAKRLWLKTF